MLSVGCPAAARLRLVVWCKTCDHRTEPDPAEIHAVWISLRPTPDRARQLRSWVVKFGVADRTAIAAAVPPERSMAPGRNGYSDHRQADASLACRRREGEVPLPVTPAMPRTAFVPRYQRFESFSLQRRVRCEPVSRGNSPSYVEKPRFSAGVRAGRAARSAETRGTRQHRAYGR